LIVRFTKIHPILVILLAGIAGLFIYWLWIIPKH
jgi:hypothetical protein